MDPIRDIVNCSGSGEIGFEGSVGKVFDNLTERAVGNGGFAVVEIKGLFGLAQCWETVSGDGCRECLMKAGKELKKGCLPRKEGRAMNAGCYLRYSDHKFFNDEADEMKESSGNSLTLPLYMCVYIYIYR